MLEGKAVVEDTDMPARMQAAATSAASRALDLFDVDDCRAIAGHIKTVRSLPVPPSPPLSVDWFVAVAEDPSLPRVQEFDRRYGVGWQCVVGASFGCFFTHSSGTFIYFSLERLTFLLFKAAPVAFATSCDSSAVS
uniref:Dynein light chain n=1 Tax=Aegilops tauschii subsp. strangulata TaxID=200361 RepID=A0A453QHW3_AEGTS